MVLSAVFHFAREVWSFDKVSFDKLFSDCVESFDDFIFWKRVLTSASGGESL